MQQVQLKSIATDFPNPERGFYQYAADPSKLDGGSLAQFFSQGHRLVYTPADLSAYRQSDLPASYLNDLEKGFALLRQNGLKAILRFAYNYPSGETGYESAQDAPLSTVQRHLTQLKPILARNADVIAVLQGGFIGAWGEWHTSSNGLTAPAAKMAVRDALLGAVPSSRQVQFRYPGDIKAWYPQPATVAELLADSAKGRSGAHNDCLLASPDDVGTYFAQTPAESTALRNYAQTATQVISHGGETCKPPDEAKARMSCSAILAEGQSYHLGYLNRSYYQGFFDRWEAGGCMTEVSKQLGYRLELKQVQIPTQGTAGQPFAWSISLSNTGWARPLNARQLVLRLTQGSTVHTLPLNGDLRTAGSGETLNWQGSVTLPAGMAPGVYAVSLGAPDAATNLRTLPAYAIRFANADQSALGQKWSPELGVFDLGVSLTVR